MPKPKHAVPPPRAERSCRSARRTIDLGSELTAEEVEFGQAVDRWRRQHPGRFPKLSDYLAILKGLGYRKEAN